MDSTFDRIVDILHEEFEIDPSIEITMDSTFEDFDMESIELIGLGLQCEEEFGITIEIDELPKTMADFVALVDSLMDAS